MSVWPKRNVAGQYNALALCTRCGLDAGQTPFTRYVQQAINRGPYLCDRCLAQEAA